MKAAVWWQEDGFIPRLLSPLSVFWSLGGRVRRIGITPYRAQVPLICVGNVTTGGSGKTPVTQALVRELLAQGRKPGILSRGYGGSEMGPLQVDPGAHMEAHTAAQVGDEPLLHAALAPTVIAKNRADGARFLERLGVDVIVMDDGLQNPSIRPSAALLVIDGATGFGNGRLIPAGPLRETVAAALSKCQAVAIIGARREGESADLTRHLTGFNGPVFRGRVEPGAEADRFRGRRVLAFAGIGRPEKLVETLRDLGADVVGLERFDDHHAYRPDEITALVARAKAADATLVTTTKDQARLPTEARPMVDVVAVNLIWDEPSQVTTWLTQHT